MDYKTILGIVGAVISIFGGAFTLVGKLNKQYRNMVRAEQQVRSLGTFYRYVRVYPIRVMWWALLVLCIVGLLVIFEGVAESTLPLLSALLQYYLILPLAFGVLFVCAFFDLPTRAILFFSWIRNANIQFNPGYINAQWQLDDPEEITAMNYEPNNCSILGVAIMNLMITEDNPPAERAPVPDGVSESDMANYIFFGCVIEHWVHRLIKDRTRLNQMWRYLAWAANSAERPFAPAQLSAHRADYFDFLRGINEHIPGGQGELPVRQEISEATNNGADWLATEWHSDASRLATSNIFNRPSPITLLESLERTSPFNESDGLRRLYLKLSARMRVWPQFDPGPFLYPFYSGIALLLLNSGCILVSEGTNRIEPNANEGFRSLVASAEDKVVKASLHHLRNNPNDVGMHDFSTRVFNCPPGDLDEWSFFDYVDLWLFTHTRRLCTVRTKEQVPTPCLLKTDDQNCFCVTPAVEWRPDQNSLVRE
jgi:hypothetical protein